MEFLYLALCFFLPLSLALNEYIFILSSLFFAILFSCFSQRRRRWRPLIVSIARTTRCQRLYTQLEVLKNKTLRQDNPHISKRRGGRKPAHRRFSLQVHYRSFHISLLLSFFYHSFLFSSGFFSCVCVCLLFLFNSVCEWVCVLFTLYVNKRVLLTSIENLVKKKSHLKFGIWDRIREKKISTSKSYKIYCTMQKTVHHRSDANINRCCSKFIGCTWCNQLLNVVVSINVNGNFLGCFSLGFFSVCLVCLFKDIFVVIRAFSLCCHRLQCVFHAVFSSNYSTLSVSEWMSVSDWVYVLLTLFNRLNINGLTVSTNSGVDNNVPVYI